MPERRTRTRVKVQYRADVSTSNARLEDLETRDLSHKGVFIMGGQLPAGEPCQVTIHLCGSPEEDPAMHMEGTVVRSTTEGTAIDFQFMDPDTYLHMRNLVLRHAPDTEEVEKEFTTPAFGPAPGETK